MPKKIYFFILVFFLSFPICASEENETFSNINETNMNETFSNTNETESDYNTKDEYVTALEKMNYTNILYLDDSNYTEILNKTDVIFVTFYVPWCYYSELFMPYYLEAANYSKENNMKVSFSRILCNLSPNATEDYKVEVYPTIYLILKGKKFIYKGIRNKDGLFKFLNKKLNDDIFIINKLDEINEYKKNDSLTFLSTLKNKSSPLYKSFYDLALNSFDHYFLSCVSEECLKKYGEDIILFKDFDEKENSYSKDYGKIHEAKENSLDDFISIFGIEAGVFLGKKQIDLLIKNENKKALIYVRNDSVIEDTKYDILFKELGRELRFDNIYAFVSDNGEKEESNIGYAFSNYPEDLPSIFYYVQDNQNPDLTVKLYSLRSLDMKNITKEDIKKFIKDVNNNKIRRDLFSQPPSYSTISNGLRNVVGRTFDKYVTDEKRNVFLALIVKEDRKDEERLFLGILRNLTTKFENISFCYLNLNGNEPRDLPLNDEIFPIGFLYTNAMEKKEIIKFVPKNISRIYQEEIELFLDDNINKKNITVEPQKKENVQTDL